MRRVRRAHDGQRQAVLSQDDVGGLTYAVGAGAALPCGTATTTNTLNVNAVGSANADTLVVGFTAADIVDGTIKLAAGKKKIVLIKPV